MKYQEIEHLTNSPRPCELVLCNSSELVFPDVGVMSGCIIFILKDLHITEVHQEVLVGCLSFISLLGSIAAGKMSDVTGLAATVFQARATTMAFAPSFAMLMAGRSRTTFTCE
jgi:MFS family permease